MKDHSFENMTIGELRELTEQFRNFPEISQHFIRLKKEKSLSAQELIDEIK